MKCDTPQCILFSYNRMVSYEFFSVYHSDLPINNFFYLLINDMLHIVWIIVIFDVVKHPRDKVTSCYSKLILNKVKVHEVKLLQTKSFPNLKNKNKCHQYFFCKQYPSKICLLLLLLLIKFLWIIHHTTPSV